MAQDYEFRYGGDDPLKKAKDAFRAFQFDLRWLGVIVLLGIFIAAALTSYYTVEPEENAVVLRFGKYHTTTGPGLHAKAPFGIDKAFKLPILSRLRQEFGFRTETSRFASTRYSETSFEEEASMLTGDLNIMNVEWVVQYEISEPETFLFEIRDPEGTLRDISQAVMRRVVGDRMVTEVLTAGKAEIEIEAKRLTQEILDSYIKADGTKRGIGIRIVEVKLQDTSPPEPVKPAFTDVIAAKQEKERLIQQAEREKNEVIPRADGEAKEKISEAEGRKTALLNRAFGDAQRFQLVFEEYKKAPEITKRRLYLEAMEKLYSRYKSITIVDDGLKGLLPIFNTAPDAGRRSQ